VTVAAEGNSMAGTEQATAPPLLETVEEHLCRSTPRTRPDATAREIRRELLGKRFECASEVAVCKEGKLGGAVPLRSRPASMRCPTWRG